MFTHGRDFGQTDHQQNLAIKRMLKDQPKDSKISQILERINYRYLAIESIKTIKEEGYHACKSKELLNTVQAIFRQTGTLTTNHFALSTAHSIKVSQNVFEEKLTHCVRVVVEEYKTYEKNEKAKEETRDAKEEAKTKKQTTNLLYSEESVDLKNKEKGNSESKQFYRCLESVMCKAMSQGKSFTVARHEDENQTVTTFKYS